MERLEFVDLIKKLWGNATECPKVLDLRDKGLSPEQLKEVLGAIALNTRITHLDLQNHKNSEYLVKSILQNHNITRLDLSDTGIDAQSVSSMILQNKYLTHLDVSFNGFDNDDADVIARALQANKAIAWMNMSNNNISVSGAEIIARAIEVNHYITWLNLSNNRIGEDMLDRIEALVNKNKVILQRSRLMSQ